MLYLLGFVLSLGALSCLLGLCLVRFSCYFCCVCWFFVENVGALSSICVCPLSNLSSPFPSPSPHLAPRRRRRQISKRSLEAQYGPGRGQTRGPNTYMSPPAPSGITMFIPYSVASNPHQDLAYMDILSIYNMYNIAYTFTYIYI